MLGRIGLYRLESPLGRGGMGEVFLAWDERLERRVAIKRIRHDDAVLPAHLRDRFRREARMAARLSHASIVQIYDLVTDGDADAIVMEYVEGVTLTEHLAPGPLETEEALRLARQIAEGLAAAHEAGLIHRDLKAENVVVTRSGQAKILDFGLARPLTSENEPLITQHGAIVGTCHAMSPEQVSGEELDERTDLFSFGVLLYQMLTGRLPFRGKNPLGTLKLVLTEQPAPLSEVRPDLPAGLTSLVEQLLAKDRNQRPQSAFAVARKLERLEQGLSLASDTVSELPTHAYPVLPEHRSGAAAVRSAPMAERLPQRARGWMLFLAGALAALIIAMLALYLRSRTSSALSSSRPLRVVIYTDIPNVAGPAGEHLAMTATCVQSAAFSGLSRLEGISPINPSDGDQPGALPQEIARAFAAQEILYIRLDQKGSSVTVTLQRRKSDGTVRRTDKPFRVVNLSPDELSALASAIETRIRKAYSEKHLRPGAPKLDVRASDYAGFITLQLKVNQGKSPDESDLAHLREIVHSSPHFLDALILASRVYRSRFQSTRDPADRDLAIQYARQAQDISSSDPRAVVAHFKIALEGESLADAKADLKRIEELMPGDPQLLGYQADLADRQGQTEQALFYLRDAVSEDPSWRNLLALADVEIKLAHVNDARQHLQQLLEISPGNPWGMSKLADLELLYGESGKAEQLYQQLVSIQPKRAYFTNLGLAQSLLGKHEKAVEAYQRALVIIPGHAETMLDLAEAELALGHKKKAKRLFGDTLERIEERQTEIRLLPSDRLIQAQCLVRLGDTRKAVEITQQVLWQGANDPQMLYAATVVYFLAGERNSALASAQAALDKHLRREWFDLPALGPFKEDPDLRQMLDKTAVSGSS